MSGNRTNITTSKIVYMYKASDDEMNNLNQNKIKLYLLAIQESRSKQIKTN